MTDELFDINTQNIINGISKITIIEQNNQNIDFILVEWFKTYKNSQIISFYQPKNHYDQILSKIDTKTNIQTVFENTDFVVDSDACIIDDYYTAKNYELPNMKNCKKIIKIFRSNTSREFDLYLSELNIVVSSLLSGSSSLLDGSILIYDREQTHADYKYKYKAKTLHLYK